MFGKVTRVTYGSDAEVSEDMKVLSLDGLIFDKIEFVDPAPDFNGSLVPGLEWIERLEFGSSARVSLVRLRKAATRWQLVVASRDRDPYIDEPGGSDEAFGRTLIADRIPHSTKLHPPFSSHIENFKSYLSKPLSEFLQAPVNIQTYPYSIFAMKAFQRRAFMITDKGYMGLAPSHAQVGDLVCIFRKGDVPFILRPIGEGYHELVGGCFVHGIMDESFAQRAEVEEVKGFHIK